ncbi:MAG: chemotaxis protein CheW [Planctomycetota bacterium]
MTNDAPDLITCRIGDSLIGIELDYVQEINRLVQATYVPRMPPAIRGLVNLRGSLVTVVDMSSILYGEPCEPIQTTRNIVVDFAGERYGLLVDSVGDVLETNGRRLEPLPSHTPPTQARWFSGLVQCESEVLLVLDIDAVLTPREDEANTSPATA